MKSQKEDDTRKINLDDILKERRIVEDEIMGRVSSNYDKEEKLRAKGEAYLELYEKVKQVFSQYCHFFAVVESA